MLFESVHLVIACLHSSLRLRALPYIVASLLEAAARSLGAFPLLPSMHETFIILIMAERLNVGGESLMRTHVVSKQSQNEEKHF